MIVTLRDCDEAEARSRLPELGALLVDAVAGGASVNFLAPFTQLQGEAFWSTQQNPLGTGEKRLLVAEAPSPAGPRIVGTVLLALATQPNGLHRAEIGKMLVHSSSRRQGIGRRLLDAAEAAARDAGRTLLLLDTEAGSDGDALYAACGWTQYGILPDHSYTPDGRLAAAAFFFKVLGQHRRPGIAA